MSFSEILIALKDGKKVRRKGWIKGSFLVFSNGLFWTEKGRIRENQTYMNDIDILANDWEIINNPDK